MSNPDPADETSLRNLIEILWRDKWIVVVLTVLFTAGAIVAAFVTPRAYRAAVVLSPSNGGQTGGMAGLGGLGSQLGGLASLAGISLRPDNSKSETLAILGSDVLARRFIDEEHMLPELFNDRWDAGRKQWTEKVPTLQEGVRRFRDIANIDESTKTGLVTLSIVWRDPKHASDWANGLTQLANGYIRDRAIQRAERNIAYLKEQAAQTDVAPLRNAISSLMESEIKNAMVARGADEYAFTVIDPAVTPDIPWSPRRKVWAIVGFLGGFFFSILVVFVRYLWRQPVSR